MARNELTELYYPNKVPLKTFIEIMIDSIYKFEINISSDNTDRYTEEWIAILLQWMEIHNE